jgi:hypothetical protein
VLLVGHVYAAAALLGVAVGVAVGVATGVGVGVGVATGVAVGVVCGVPPLPPQAARNSEAKSRAERLIVPQVVRKSEKTCSANRS